MLLEEPLFHILRYRQKEQDHKGNEQRIGGHVGIDAYHRT